MVMPPLFGLVLDVGRVEVVVAMVLRGEAVAKAARKTMRGRVVDFIVDVGVEGFWWWCCGVSGVCSLRV